MTPTRRLPLLVRLSPNVDEDLLRSLHGSIHARIGDFHIEMVDDDQSSKAARLKWRTVRGGLWRSVAFHIHDAIRTPMTTDAESVGIGIACTLRAAVDPSRRLDHRTWDGRLAELVCDPVSDEVPTPKGTVDTVEVLLPTPWCGMVASRITMPPFSSGVTSLDNEFRKTHTDLDIIRRVDRAIAPTAMIVPGRSHDGPTVEIVGGTLAMHRRTSPLDAMERLRRSVELERLLELGLRPLATT